MPTLFLDPGQLRTELSLQTLTRQPDGMGGFAETWSELATVFARIEPLAATSRFGADQTLEQMTHRITLRFRDDLASGQRFVRHGRVFEIVTVHDADETGRYMICGTRETGR